MPAFVVDGKRYRISFMSFLKGSTVVSEELLSYSSRKHGKAFSRSPMEDAAADRTWSTEEDRLLQELKVCHIPWKHVAVAMGNRPIEQLKRRWIYLQNRKSKRTEDAGWPRQIDYENSRHDYDRDDYDRDLYGRDVMQGDSSERRVSFSRPLTTMDETGESDDYHHTPKIKKVYYFDSDLEVEEEEVHLLHKIAAKWERDRWRTISTRFNDQTGHNITPEQAKWMIDH